MQPKRITTQKTVRQRETSYKQSPANFSTVSQSFREPTGFSHRGFAGQEDFTAGEVTSMDFAWPEVIDPACFRCWVHGP